MLGLKYSILDDAFGPQRHHQTLTYCFWLQQIQPSAAIFHEIAYITVLTAAEHQSDFNLTTDSPYFALTGELCSAYCEDSGKIDRVIMVPHSTSFTTRTTQISHKSSFCKVSQCSKDLDIWQAVGHRDCWEAPYFLGTDADFFRMICVNNIASCECPRAGVHLNIKMSAYKYRNPIYKEKTVSWPSYLQIEIPYQERRSFYWDGAQVV